MASALFVRCLARETSHGASEQHEATSFSLALLLATERLNVISAVHPGMWHPGVLAKFINTADQLSGGRAAVNVVSGWLKDEFTGFGLPWLEHDERYVRTDEFIRALRGIWTQEDFTQHGRYYSIDGVSLKPGPVDVPGRAHPDVFFGGNSSAAPATAGRVADWYFSNGRTLEDYTDNVAGVIEASRSGVRSAPAAPRFGINGFVVAREAHGEAVEQLRDIVDSAHTPAVEGFQRSVQHAGASTGDGKGMWADSTFEDLVQLLLTAYLHFQEELTTFGEEFIPRVREREAQVARANGVEFRSDEAAEAAAA